MASDLLCDNCAQEGADVKKKYSLLLIVFGALLVFLCLNIGIGKLGKGWGIDVTQDRIFTLSQTSKSIVKATKDPIYLDLYFSQTAAAQNPPLRNYGKQVSDLLRTYESASHGKIIFREHDVEQFTQSEDEAIQNGLVPYKDNENIENDIYFGLVAKSGGRQAVIPFFSQSLEDNLEYNITKIIADFQKTSLVKIGVITGLPWLFSNNLPQNSIAKDIADNYDTLLINNDFSQLPAEIKLLIIAQPQNLSDTQIGLIKSFADNGGRLVIMADAASSISADNGAGVASFDGSMAKLLAQFGIMASNDVVIDAKGALPVETVFQGRKTLAPQPLYFNAAFDGNSSKDDNIKSALSRGVNFASPSYIQKIGDGFEFVPLLISSNDTMLIHSNEALKSPSPQTLLEDFNPSGNSYVLAALVKGSLGQKVLVIGDTDFLSENLYAQKNSKVADNAEFVMNALDVLSGDDELVPLRGKTQLIRSLKRIENMRNQGEQEIISQQTRLEEQLNQYEQLVKTSQNQNATSALFGENNKSGNLDKAKSQLLETRRELRDLQNKVRHDIDAVKNIIVLICAILIPITFVILGIVRYNRANKLRATKS